MSDPENKNCEKCLCKNCINGECEDSKCQGILSKTPNKYSGVRICLPNDDCDIYMKG